MFVFSKNGFGNEFGVVFNDIEVLVGVSNNDVVVNDAAVEAVFQLDARVDRNLDKFRANGYDLSIHRLLLYFSL